MGGNSLNPNTGCNLAANIGQSYLNTANNLFLNMPDDSRYNFFQQPRNDSKRSKGDTKRSVISNSFNLDRSNKSISGEIDSKLNLGPEEDDFNLQNYKYINDRRGQSIASRREPHSDKMIDNSYGSQ